VKLLTKVTNILIVGVGGQGTILAGRLISQVALQKGYEVKVSELHGMSQRGGSVSTQVRYGAKVFAPVIKKGDADYILAFEKLEALRWLPFASPQAKIIVNEQEIPPLSVINGEEDYPSYIIEELQKRRETIVVPALQIAEAAGNLKSVNMVLAGVLSSFLEFEEEVWLKVLKETVPSATVEANTTAFKKGKELSLSLG